MISRKAVLSIIMLSVVGLILTACAQRQVRYLKNNIHTVRSHRGELKASYTNWVKPRGGHRIIPVNTPIVIGRWRRGFTFVTQDNRQRVLFEYNQRNMPYSIREYINLISSPQPVSPQAFSDIDQKGIHKGSAFKGMSKEGVLVALGYPAAHQTPSLDDDVWIYWRDRMWRMKVTFDVDGKVISIR